MGKVKNKNHHGGNHPRKLNRLLLARLNIFRGVWLHGHTPQLHTLSEQCEKKEEEVRELLYRFVELPVIVLLARGIRVRPPAC